MTIASAARNPMTWEVWAGSPRRTNGASTSPRSEEHTSELQSRGHLVCRLLLEKKKKTKITHEDITKVSDQDREHHDTAPSVSTAPLRFPIYPTVLFSSSLPATATPEIYTLSLHDALPISRAPRADR